MNADGKGLFAAICADPEDDASRLVYADWLDEHGDEPRAEALRMSVERRRLPDWAPRAWVLDARLERQHVKHHEAWNAEVPARDGVEVWVSDSGLVESIRVSSIRGFLDREEEIFSTGPIASIELHSTSDSAADLASCPSMARVRKLQFWTERVEQLGLYQLASSPYLENLRDLDLAHSGLDIGPIKLAAYLARCPPFPRLEALAFQHRHFPDAWPRQAPLLRTVSKLALKSCTVSNQWYRQLFRLPSAAAFRHLDLDNCDRDPQMYADFFAVEWEALESLRLRSNGFDVTAAHRLATCPRTNTLRSLDLSHSSSFEDKGVMALARSEFLGGLRVLVLSGNDITGTGFTELGRASWAGSLASLDLSNNPMRKEGTAALASPAFEGLRRLELYNTNKDFRIGLRELAPLLDSPWACKLTHLDLRYNNLGAKAARLICTALSPENIEVLQLDNNRIPKRDRELLRERFGDRVRVDDWRDI